MYSYATCQFVRIKPSSLTKLPVPPRPAAPIETKASLSATVPSPRVPSISAAGTFRPMARSGCSSSCTAVMGQVRKRPKTLGSSARLVPARTRAARSIS